MCLSCVYNQVMANWVACAWDSKHRRMHWGSYLNSTVNGISMRSHHVIISSVNHNFHSGVSGTCMAGPPVVVFNISASISLRIWSAKSLPKYLFTQVSVCEAGIWTHLLMCPPSWEKRSDSSWHALAQVPKCRICLWQEPDLQLSWYPLPPIHDHDILRHVHFQPNHMSTLLSHVFKLHMTGAPVCTVVHFMQGTALTKFDHYVNVSMSSNANLCSLMITAGSRLNPLSGSSQ